MSIAPDAALQLKAATLSTRTVMLITGAWMHVSSWDKFRKAFDAAGFETVAPAWPGLDKGAAELRNAPVAGLDTLTLGKLVDHYARIIATLPEPPLLVGHSMGGLVVQLLLDRGLGLAGVVLSPGPVGGALPGPTPLLSALPVLLKGPGQTHLLSRAAFARNFANALPSAELAKAYDAHVVPTATNIFYQAALMAGTWVQPRRRKQPLLILAAEKDRTVTPALSRASYNIQKGSAARTEIKLFAGRSHFLAGEPGWEEVAQYAIGWACEVL